MKTILDFLVFILIPFGFSVVLAGQNAKSGDDCSGCHFPENQIQSAHYINYSNDCGFCHQASNSTDRHEITTVKDNYTCLSCHHEQEPAVSTGSHDAFYCVDCHDPHESNDDYRLKSPVVSLCSETCHTADQLGRSHPVGQGVIDKATGGEMTCVSTCHSVHSPRNEKLLQLAGGDLCGQCHADKY